MLQMTCPNCKGVVKSDLLAEISTLECALCKEDIPVKDLFISTDCFIMRRDDFLNRTFRFQKLLREVEKERLLMANDQEAPAESLESLNQFCSSLQDLLAGARKSYRMEIPCELHVEVNDHSRKSEGKLVNLSTDGGSIEFLVSDKIPRKKSELEISFSIPESPEHLYTHAKVVWSKEQINDNGSQGAIIGVAFIAMDESTRNRIWNYILDNAPVPFQRVSR